MKTIVTIGTGYSGSSAVYEFLRLTNNFYDPFPNIEFSLTYDPGGVMDIDECINKNFSPNKTTLIYEQFKKNIAFYTSKDYGLKQGKNMSIYNHSITNLLNEYLESLVEIKYEGQSLYLKYNNNLFLNFLSKLAIKFNKKIPKEIFLFCENENFQKITKIFFEKLFNINNHKKKNILLDQGGSIWNPYNSTKYYNEPRCILIFRDPRDIFSEFKSKSVYSYPGKDIKIFCDWYKKIMSNINSKEIERSNILKINFEDFINKNKDTIHLISEHIQTEINTNNINYDFSRSISNIQRYKKNLSEKEIQTIENNLKKYLYI